jgi:hypothetical protein
MQRNQMKQILIQRKQKHATSWKLSITSCAVEGHVCPDEHVANMLLSFRLRSYSNSRVTPQCHEQFVTYITLIAKDCVYLLDNGERHFCQLRRCFWYSADILQCQHSTWFILEIISFIYKYHRRHNCEIFKRN